MGADAQVNLPPTQEPFTRNGAEKKQRHPDTAWEIGVTVRAGIHGVAEQAELVFTKHTLMLVTSVSSHVWFELLGRVEKATWPDGRPPTTLECRRHGWQAARF